MNKYSRRAFLASGVALALGGDKLLDSQPLRRVKALVPGYDNIYVRGHKIEWCFPKSEFDELFK